MSKALYFDNSEDGFRDNIDYHFADVVDGQLEGHEDWVSEFDDIEEKQSALEMLDAYDAFVIRAVQHSTDAIYAAKKRLT